MSEFKVGDKVKVKDVELCKAKCIHDSAITDEVRIVSTYNSDNDWDSVTFENDRSAYFWPVEALELVERSEVMEDKKYTIQEIFQAIDTWSSVNAPWAELENIEQELQKTYDPEYKEYLRLKTKFE